MGIFMLPRDKLWAASLVFSSLTAAVWEGKLCTNEPWCVSHILADAGPASLCSDFFFPVSWHNDFFLSHQFTDSKLPSGADWHKCSVQPWGEVFRLSIRKLTNPGWFFPSPPEHAWPWEQRPCLDHKHNLTGNGILNNSKIRAPRG